MRKYLFILILLLAPQLAFALSCSISFDTNPILYGQGTYLRWYEGISGGVAEWGGFLNVNNYGTVGSFPAGVSSSRSGAVWVAPGATTDYSAVFYLKYKLSSSYYAAASCPATLYVNYNSCTFNGATVAHGASVTAYQASTVPYGSSCTSQSRTCTNGTLSGSYTYSSCVVGPYCTLTTDWDPINKDVGTIMRWTSANATSFSISGIGSVPLSGSANIYPQTTTTYTGTATGAGGSANCTKTVNVAPPATGSISLSPMTILQGNTSMLSWSTQNADEGVYISNIGWVSANGSVQVNPSSNTTYMLTAYGFGGTNAYNASLSVLRSCVLDGVTLQSGQSRTFYSQTSVPQGTTCSSVSQTRTCTDGTLSGSASYQYSACACDPSSSYSCSGQNIVRTSIDASCATTVTNPYTTCVSPAFCSAGSAVCLLPPITFIQSGDKSGHLQIRPQIVRKGAPTKVFWNVDNVTGCTVTSHGDSWIADTSGPNGQTSHPIDQQTIFTLQFTGLDGSTIRETATAGVIPVFQEI